MLAAFFLFIEVNVNMNITILCKVVDNFGDIGVVYRLAKRIKKIRPNVALHLVVDNLSSFNKICDVVDCDKKFQIVEKIEVYKWDDFDFCYDQFSKNDGEKLEIILECFQCGRPEWMEKILFEDKLERVVNIIMIDYLTAEKYAEDFHCLKSLTRSSKVQKVNFMPGFTNKTGGLIIDDAWNELIEKSNNDDICGDFTFDTYKKSQFLEKKILLFTYEKDLTSLANAISKSSYKKVLIAQGRGAESAVKAFEKCSDFNYELLPYLNQSKWDELMKSCSVLFIRGEESLSRACLSGIPFVWHAYPQSEEYQMVKVNALLERMKRHFSEDDFKIVEDVWMEMNTSVNTSMTDMTDTGVWNFSLDTAMTDTSVWNLFLQKADELQYGFRSFALDLRKNGDLANNLMTFIEKNIII